MNNQNKTYAYEVSKTTVCGCQDFGGTPAIFQAIHNNVVTDTALVVRIKASLNNKVYVFLLRSTICDSNCKERYKPIVCQSILVGLKFNSEICRW